MVVWSSVEAGTGRRGEFGYELELGAPMAGGGGARRAQERAAAPWRALARDQGPRVGSYGRQGKG